MSDTAWFTEARYGMFIHWGPYSVGARGEWTANRECWPQAEYRANFVDPWRAEAYDPEAWADLAVAAGMKYAVLTTKHHDGFCLWPTATSDWNAGAMGPKRDLVGPFVEAMRGKGIKVGLYLSGAEWYHPDYPDRTARDWPTAWPDAAAHRRLIAHVDRQVEELLTRYGSIDVLWWDGCLPNPFDASAINEMAKRLQPHILINERNGQPCDYVCAEQTTKAKAGCWESCLTLNDNWGYHDGDDHWKDPKEVIRKLIAVAGQGGNLLLNVGPRGDGSIPEASVEILTAAGRWLAKNREWMPDSGRNPFTWNNTVMPTVKGHTVYLHFLCNPGGRFRYAEIGNKVLSARLLSTGQAVPFAREQHVVTLTDLPADLEEGIAFTVALEVEGEPRPFRTQETFWIPE